MNIHIAILNALSSFLFESIFNGSCFFTTFLSWRSWASTWRHFSTPPRWKQWLRTFWFEYPRI